MWDYVRGLLGPVGRENSWQLAEYADHATLYGLHLLPTPAGAPTACATTCRRTWPNNSAI